MPSHRKDIGSDEQDQPRVGNGQPLAQLPMRYAVVNPGLTKRIYGWGSRVLA